jgi:hypothetical protein
LIVWFKREALPLLERDFVGFQGLHKSHACLFGRAVLPAIVQCHFETITLDDDGIDQPLLNVTNDLVERNLFRRIHPPAEK